MTWLLSATVCSSCWTRLRARDDACFEARGRLLGALDDMAPRPSPQEVLESGNCGSYPDDYATTTEVTDIRRFTHAGPIAAEDAIGREPGR